MQNVNRKFKIWGALLFLLFFAVGVSMYFTAANVQAATKTGFVTINGDSYYINEDLNRRVGWNLKERNITLTQRPVFR